MLKNSESPPLFGAMAFGLRLARGMIILLFAASLSLAQTSGSSTLRGKVRDPNGELIEKATITLISEATKEERKTQTNDEGFYQFSSVVPGMYTVRVEMDGFKTAEQKSVALLTSDIRGLDFSLEVGAKGETVTVAAGEVEQIQKETGAKENTITAKQIESLSIISRSSLELLRILPGVVAPDQADLESLSFGGGANANSNYSVNGLRGVNNNVTVDGSRVMDIGSNNGTMITANPDMVQEVKVQTANYASEHGSSGIQISATTKSGSGEYHGTIYDYIRDWRFNANDRSNSYAGIERGKSKYNYPGGNIGGPVLIPGTNFNKNRDKLFFFAGFEYYYQRIDDGATLSVVPSEAQRRGDFSGLLTGRPQANNFNQGQTVNVPFGCTVNGVGVGNPAPNNNLAPCIDPLGQALINLFPLPNFTDPNNRFNYVYNVIRPLDRNQFIARFDYNITDNTRLYVRLAREREDQAFPRGLWWNSSDLELPSHVLGTNLGRSVSANLVQTLSSTMTNEILVSGSRLLLDNDFKDPSKVSFEALNAPQINGFFPQNTPYLPLTIIDAWGGGIGGNLFTAYPMPLFAHNDSYSVTDNFSKVYNTHAFKFGFTIEQANKTQNFNGNDVAIELAQWGQPNGTGNNYGDLLVGRPIQVAQSTTAPTGHFRYYNYEFYAQDSWKVRSNFTLEYGLRFAYMPLNEERDGLAIRFDIDRYDRSQGLFINGDRTRPNGVLLAKRGEIPKGITESPGVRLMPRLNFAWDINGKGETVIRGGGGIFFNRVQGNYEYYSLTQPPNAYGAVAGHWAVPNGLTFANLNTVDPFSNVAAVNLQSRNPSSIEHPQTFNYSLSVARRIPFEQVLEVAYVSTLARHLPQNISINIVPEGAINSGFIGEGAGRANLSNPLHRHALDGAAIRSFLPFPVYNTVRYNQFTGTSNYHSLQATLSRQAGKHLQYFATYTFSKALGTTAVNETDGAAFADPIDTRGRSWGVLPFDRTHIFNISYNWQIPSIARGAFENKATRAIFNGWQMSGITTFQSGIPIRLRFFGDLASGGVGLAWFGSNAFGNVGQNTGAVAPIYLGDPRVSGSKSVGARILDLNAFAIPTFANSGPRQPPFYIKTPSRSNFDVSFFKDFQFTERHKFQFRTGFFNIFNQAYPTRIDIGNPGASDIHLRLNTVCNRRVDGVPNGVNATVSTCDPTGGYSFDADTINNFGKITNKRGRRVIEFAFKYYF
jgi:hypothetical protein